MPDRTAKDRQISDNLEILVWPLHRTFARQLFLLFRCSLMLLCWVSCCMNLNMNHSCGCCLIPTNNYCAQEMLSQSRSVSRIIFPGVWPFLCVTFTPGTSCGNSPVWFRQERMCHVWFSTMLNNTSSTRLHLNSVLGCTLSTGFILNVKYAIHTSSMAPVITAYYKIIFHYTQPISVPYLYIVLTFLTLY